MTHEQIERYDGPIHYGHDRQMNELVMCLCYSCIGVGLQLIRKEPTALLENRVRTHETGHADIYIYRMQAPMPANA